MRGQMGASADPDYGMLERDLLGGQRYGPMGHVGGRIFSGKSENCKIN